MEIMKFGVSVERELILNGWAGKILFAMPSTTVIAVIERVWMLVATGRRWISCAWIRTHVRVVSARLSIPAII